MSFRTYARRSASLALAISLVLSACGTTTPTPPQPTAAPTAAATGRPAAEVYAEIRDAVVAIRGLQPTASVDPVTVDQAQMLAGLAAEFDAAQTPAQLKDAEDLLIALGLLPAGASLRAITLDFQSGQVAGYYSPERDELFVVNRSGSLGPVDEATYAHEFTHQLQDQDQRIDLDALGLDATDQSDRLLARLALVEGDASTVQSSWMAANLDAKELGELLAASLDPEALAALQRAPAILRDTAIFPYQDGLAFVTRIASNGGYAAVDAAYGDPPDSTEQILHPDKYLDRERPIEVTLPDGLAATLGTGWSEAGRDTLGELMLSTWLREGGVPSAEARTAATGWGGDRLVLLRGPSGETGVGLMTQWDSIEDAGEFAAAARTAIAGLDLHGEILHIANRSTEVVVAIGDRTADVLAALARFEPGG